MNLSFTFNKNTKINKYIKKLQSRCFKTLDWCEDIIIVFFMSWQYKKKIFTNQFLTIK